MTGSLNVQPSRRPRHFLFPMKKIDSRVVQTLLGGFFELVKSERASRSSETENEEEIGLSGVENCTEADVDGADNRDDAGRDDADGPELLRR